MRLYICERVAISQPHLSWAVGGVAEAETLGEVTVHTPGQTDIGNWLSCPLTLTCRKCRTGLDPDVPPSPNSSSMKQESSVTSKVNTQQI